MYDCDFSLTIRGVTYTFTEVENLQIDDPERTKLIRGSNAGNKTGLAYKEGLKEPKTITLTVIGIPAELHTLLKDVYDKKERLDCNCISRVDGSAKIAKNAIMAQSPKQLNLDDTAESMNTALIFESFDVSEVHKS
jgi:hypothetical protein